MKPRTRFRLDEMEYQYNRGVSVPEYPELAKMRAAQAHKVRDSAKSWLNVAYAARAPSCSISMPQISRPDGARLYSRRLLAQRQ